MKQRKQKKIDRIFCLKHIKKIKNILTRKKRSWIEYKNDI